jgi:hypothetical protein
MEGVPDVTGSVAEEGEENVQAVKTKGSPKERSRSVAFTIKEI